MQKSHSREAEAAIAAIVEQRAQADAEYRRSLSTEAVEAERKAAEYPPGRDQGRAADRIAAAAGAGRRHRSAARGPHDRRRGHPGAVPARAGSRRQPDRDRGDAVEPRHRLRLCRAGRRDQGRHLQLHQIRPAARQGAQRLAGCDQPRPSARRLGQDARRRRRHERAGGARNSSTPPGSRSTGPRCRSTTSWSASPRAWR